MKILIRGAGDLATGIAAELWERGHQILMTDVAIPLTVRREVAFSRAVYEEHAVVEGIEAVLAENFEEAETIMATRKIAVMVDEKAEVQRQRPTPANSSLYHGQHLGCRSHSGLHTLTEELPSKTRNVNFSPRKNSMKKGWA